MPDLEYIEVVVHIAADAAGDAIVADAQTWDDCEIEGSNFGSGERINTDGAYTRTSITMRIPKPVLSSLGTVTLPVDPSGEIRFEKK